MVNFYIVNALGQNLANSESCPILRLYRVYHIVELWCLVASGDMEI
jgi:hypothetical protein